MNNDEPYINEDLIARLDFVEEENMLRQEGYDVMEERHLSELYRIADNYDKKELLAICMMTVRKYPFAYLQVLAEWILDELISKKRRRRSRGDDDGYGP